MDVKLIRAFIASPGGLEEERRAAFAAAEEVNRSVAKPLGGRLELMGWEETLSGVGRPQAIINADMETCDLFIGAIWTSWGSRPSIDGPYTSGFEEEFELSRERNNRTNSPIMAMFFKDVDERQRRDPGEDLKKVLAFQEKLRVEKALLYNTFGDAEQFSGKVREFLSCHVIRMLMEPKLREEGPSRPEKVEQATSSSADPEPSEANARESAFLSQISKAFGGGDEPSAIDVARLRLVATTSGKSENDKQLIGVHDANLLYRHPADFSFVEKRGLLMCGLAALGNENVPVWSWLAEVERERPGALVLSSLIGEEPERVGAITAMRLLGEPIDRLERLPGEILLTYWFGEGTPASIKAAALHYLRNHGTRDQLGEVQREADLASKDTFTPALEAAIAILLRDDEAATARYVLSTSFESLSADVLRRALAHLDDLSSEELVQGLDHRSPYVRARTLSALSERNALGMETIGRALEDDAAVVRLAAVQALDRLGQPLSLDEVAATLTRPKKPTGLLFGRGRLDALGETLLERYRADRLRGMAVQPLEALLGSPQHRDAAYRALASKRVNGADARLRQDLLDGFSRYFVEHWPDGIKPEPASAYGLLGFGLSTGLTPADTETNKKRELVASALDVIAMQRGSADLPLIRQVLDRGRISPSNAVIAYLKALGSQEDVERLARTTPFSWSAIVDENMTRDFDAAAVAMLKLGADFETLVSSVIPDTMRARIIELVSPTEFAKLGNSAVVSLLLSEDEGVRRATAKKAAASLSRTKVAKILSAYWADKKGLYYLVTHWLDLGLGYPRTVARQIIAAK